MRSAALLLAALAASCATSAPSPLLGTWRSDRDSSMAFNESKAQLKPETVEFLQQIFGQMVVTFEESTVTSAMPAREVQIKGKTYPWVASNEKQAYRVLGTTPNTVAIETTNPTSGEKSIVLYTFEGPNKVWVYASYGDMHIREYFVRE